MKIQLSLALLMLSPFVSAADGIGALGCSACHGENGISSSGTIPNLAAQKSDYLVNQLNAFRDGSRKNPLMNALAVQLSDADIEKAASFFSSLPAAAEAVTGDLSSVLDPSHIMFPQNYKEDFVLYKTVNRTDNNQVRYLYANPLALKGAKNDDTLPNGSAIVMEVFKAKLDVENNPIIGDDGFYIQDTLSGYGVMEKQAGWGSKIPVTLRNADWNYAFFGDDKNHKAGINQAACLACHVPLDKDFYMFNAAALREMANK